jgi:hypothetical protein
VPLVDMQAVNTLPQTHLTQCSFQPFSYA